MEKLKSQALAIFTEDILTEAEILTIRIKSLEMNKLHFANLCEWNCIHCTKSVVFQ